VTWATWCPTSRPPSDIKIGDTITLANKPAADMLPGYKEVRPMVFCGLYPLETADYEKLKAALGRLQSERCGVCLFLGKLGRAGLRFPLRLPRAAAHGDHPGAHRAASTTSTSSRPHPSVVYHVDPAPAAN
jgi:hypothetical protein